VKISVITVCLNSAATIGRTLESFFRQDHADKELVVVDGASRDDTLKIVRSFPSDGVRVISEPDRGMYDAANKGLAVFTGDGVGLLNADDRFADEMTLTSIADGLREADIVFGNLDIVVDHESDRVVRRWRGTPYRKGGVRRGWMPAHPTFYVRRAVIEAVGAFDGRYQTAADYDFMLRALELHPFRTAFVDRVQVKMRNGGRSTAGPLAHLRHNYEALQSRRRWLGAPLVDYALFAKPASKLSQFGLPLFAPLQSRSLRAPPTERIHAQVKGNRLPVDGHEP
jgi:glycosyltransferase involved in cell wall biosynthesis